MRSLVLVAFLLPVVPAQATVVSPAEFATAAAPHATAQPFGWSTTGFRYLSVHDDLAGTAHGILAFALRRAGGIEPLAQPITVTLDCLMSTAATTAATIVDHFDSNHGLDWAYVIRGRTVNFPGQRTGLLPNPFAYRVQLDGPFLFGGNGPLCWDVQIATQTTSGTTYFDAASGAEPNPRVARSVYGDGCRGTGQVWPFRLAADSEVDWPSGRGTLIANPIYTPPFAPVACILGASATSYGGFSLPLALPGTAGGTGPCWLHCDVVTSVAATAGAFGSAVIRLPVPLQARLGGRHLFAQAFALDPSANALGAIASNGVDFQFVRPTATPPVGVVWGSLQATTGVRRPGFGLAVQFSVF